MVKKILVWAGILLVVIIGYLLYNTFQAKPWPVMKAVAIQWPLPDSAIRHMSRAIQIPTISINDTAAIDTAAFKAFEVFIDRSYPLIREHLTKTMVDQFSFVFEWKGKNPSLAPFILMGHYDVVPVEAASLDKWTVPPFGGTVKDSAIWGRGAADDKIGVIARLEATEALLRKGFVPQRTIYLCFGHDEEILGHGAAEIVKYLEQKKVHAEMVLDEGGEVTETKIQEVKRPVAAIGIAEKGYASFELTVQTEGGHSSMPGKETSIDILAAALYKLRSEPTPARLTPPVKEFLLRIGYSSDIFVNRMATANMWLFEGFAKSIMSQQPEGNAMIRTTIVPTIIESGVKDNVIPTIAKAVVNTRILPGENAKSVEKYIRETIADDRVKISRKDKYGSDPSTPTSIESPAFKRVESAVYKHIPEVLPAPFLMIGATDSRYYRRISDGVVNFQPTTDSKGYHGIDERLPIRDLQRNINFLITIIEESGKEFRK
jgi:carboxypeptidase PM20D1